MKRWRHLAVVGLAAMLTAVAFAMAAEIEVAAARDATPRSFTIGLFLPGAGPLAATGEEVSRGVAIAVDRANATGGIDGRPVRLVTAASDRLWEGAGGELVRLIYDEGAMAVIGALDGRTAHLAEQVITRARGAALFMTPWASEATLTRIRVPWFFRLVPDDHQQSEVLAREIFVLRGLSRVAVWVGDEFDGRSAAAAFRRAAPAGAIEEFVDGAPDPVEASGTVAPSPLQRLQSRIATGSIDAVVLFAGPEAALRVVEALRTAGAVPPLFGPLSLTQPRFLDAAVAEDAAITLIAPARVAVDRFEFERRYEERHKTAPGLPALYGQDAATALIEAARAAGTDRGDRLAESLNGLSFQGVTGEVRFNAQGGRDMMPVLAPAPAGAPLARRGDVDSTER